MVGAGKLLAWPGSCCLEAETSSVWTSSDKTVPPTKNVAWVDGLALSAPVLHRVRAVVAGLHPTTV